MTGAKATAEKRSRHLYRGIVRIAEGVGGGISLERHPLNGNACPDGSASGHDITANFTWERMQPERWKACLRADIGWLTRSVAKRQPSGRPGENGFKASDQTDDIDRLTEKGQSAAVQGRIPGALILIGGDEGGLGESGADPQLRGGGGHRRRWLLRANRPGVGRQVKTIPGSKLPKLHLGIGWTVPAADFSRAVLLSILGADVRSPR